MAKKHTKSKVDQYFTVPTVVTGLIVLMGAWLFFTSPPITSFVDSIIPKSVEQKAKECIAMGPTYDYVRTGDKDSYEYSCDTRGIVAPIQSQGVKPDCNIKGNISFDTGEKVYHVPGQEFYKSVAINPDNGEQFFCSEQDALDAGWRKAEH